MMTGQDFFMNTQDFHDDKLRFSWWQFKIFVLTSGNVLFAPGVTQGNEYAG